MRHVTPPPKSWRDKTAACADEAYDPEWWFSHADSPEAKEARRICRTECPLLEQCLAHALITNEQNGVWGGLSPQERRRLAPKVHGSPQMAKRCKPLCEHCIAGGLRYVERMEATREVINDF